MLNGNEIDNSVDRGLQFLRQAQLPSGEFRVYTSSDKTMETNCLLDSNLFPSALIAYSIEFSAAPDARAILEKIEHFLLEEMEGEGIWRYWTKSHPRYLHTPPDLDDMACILEVLRRRGLHFPSVRKLMLLNRNKQGLFYTWITPRRHLLPLNLTFWRVAGGRSFYPTHPHYFWNKLRKEPVVFPWRPDDVDGVVNANILSYLGASPQTQPIINYLIDVVNREEEACCDHWYRDPPIFYYAVSRNFAAGVTQFEIIRDQVIARIENSSQENGRFGRHALDTALCICALLNWKSSSSSLEPAIQFLLETQDAEGHWPRAPLYFGEDWGWGCEELTTGFCLEALLRYRDLKG